MSTATLDPSRARKLWRLIEPIHAVVYFSPAVADTLAGLGLKGFWMSYFAARSAPLGPAGHAAVTASFFGFAPTMVQRSIPDAWAFADPADVCAARGSAAALALHQIDIEIDEHTRRALPLMESAAAAARCDGRVLALANQQLSKATEPVERLWNAATTLREHRGDGHVAALVSEGLSGLESHILRLGSDLASASPTPPAEILKTRGWTEAQWDAGVVGLVERGLVDDEAVATDDGHRLWASVEHTTDVIARQPFADGLTPTGVDLLESVLRPITTSVLGSGLLPFPNPMGLPATGVSEG